MWTLLHRRERKDRGRAILSAKWSFSFGRCVSHSVLSDSAMLWAVARQVPLCIGFFRQEYWSGLPFPSPGDLPNPGIELGVQLNIEPGSPALQVGSLPSESPGKTLDCGSSSVSSEKWIYLEIILYSQLIRLPECIRRCVGRKKGVKNFELTNQKVGVIINWYWQTTEDTRVLVNRKILHLSLQTLRDPMDYGPPGFSVHGIFQARVLEWIAIPFSRGSQTQGSNTGLLCFLHCRRILYPLSHWGSPSLP